MIPIGLATEDELSEAIAGRLVSELGGKFEVTGKYRGRGFGQLRSKIVAWNRAAQSHPYLVIVDLDSAECPAQLVRDWLPQGKHHHLLLRVAVREAESWLLSDETGIRKFFGTRRNAVIADNPDRLEDPKAALIHLAGLSRHDIKLRICPRPNSTAVKGREYNSTLVDFVVNHWRPREAARKSPSLSRCFERLETFDVDWPR
jgi:hypothetical protein